MLIVYPILFFLNLYEKYQNSRFYKYFTESIYEYDNKKDKFYRIKNGKEKI
jgi:hypothetical protein